MSFIGIESVRGFFNLAKTALSYQAFKVMIEDPDFYLQNYICFQYVIRRMRRRMKDIHSDAESLKAANGATAFIEKLLIECRNQESPPSQKLLTNYLYTYIAASKQANNKEIVKFILQYWEDCMKQSRLTQRL